MTANRRFDDRRHYIIGRRRWVFPVQGVESSKHGAVRHDEAGDLRRVRLTRAVRRRTVRRG